MAKLIMAVAYFLMSQQAVCTDIRFNYLKRVMVEEGADILWSVDNVSSKLKCSTLCLANDRCACFGFVEAKGLCQVFSHGVQKAAVGKHGFISYYSKRRYVSTHHLCENDKDCNDNSALCVGGRCMCDPEFTYNASKQACQRKPGGMYQPCVKKDQCYINGSVCFKGQCMCTPGLSYHQTEQACVRHCSKYGKTMSIYEGLAIIGYNTEIQSFVFTNEKCINICSDMTDFLCLSVEIKPINLVCQLSSYGYLDVNEINRSTGEDGWLFGTRNCALD